MIAWQRDLDDAETAAEVVQLARGYVAAMPREAFALLPDHCRPAFIAHADDVRAWSARLNEAYWKRRGETQGSPALQDIWSFFLRASTRLARLEEARAIS